VGTSLENQAWLPDRANEAFDNINVLNKFDLMITSANPKYRILVVDDDLDLNTGFALLLEFDGHKVQTAYTGEAALEMLAKNHFDLMITEYWLPRMRGDHFVSLVKQKWPDLPIIMVTANFEEIHVDDHPIPGVNCLLDKPFSMDHLREAMNWTLGYRAGRQPDEPDNMEVHWVHAGRHEVGDPQDARRDNENF
jgi:DNA-binding response OmpR family regulator